MLYWDKRLPMATYSSEHSQAAQDYIDIELEEPFEFEDRLSPDEDDPLYDTARMELDDSDDDSE